MFQSMKTYVYERRQGLAKSAAVAGGVYLVGRYITERLADVRDKVMQDQIARDSLRRRFQQNQENISYTIMALIPTLGEHILEEMDVEGITQELQTKSRASKVIPVPQRQLPPSESSLASSVDLLHDHDTRSDAGSPSVSSFSGHEGTGSHLGESSHSWVDEFSASPAESSRPLPSTQDAQSPEPMHGAQLSDSITTDSSLQSSTNEESAHSESINSVVSDLSTRSKAKLWNEVKLLTFTRTLTILYSTTLLTLFTTIQLTLLGRSKYVKSILQLERDERMFENIASAFPSLIFGGEPDMVDLGKSNVFEEEDISEELEGKYLSLSWWILHVGWKDVGERVRRGVEEVFDRISLKSKLGAIDLHRLVNDVRRRVEYEVTFEGTERRIDFLSTLLPPTPETMAHVLTQAGIPSHVATLHTPTFISLLDETRTTICSADFQRVLEVCLDRTTEMLFDGLNKNVFVDEGKNVDDYGNDLKLRLAGLLPGLGRWSHLALNGLPNELVDGLMDVRETAGLSAIVFAKFEDRFR